MRRRSRTVRARSWRGVAGTTASISRRDPAGRAADRGGRRQGAGASRVRRSRRRISIAILRGGWRPGAAAGHRVPVCAVLGAAWMVVGERPGGRELVAREAAVARLVVVARARAGEVDLQMARGGFEDPATAI